MDVTFDEHGELFRPWGTRCRILVESTFDDVWLVPGSRTVLWLCKAFSKAG